MNKAFSIILCCLIFYSISFSSFGDPMPQFGRLNEQYSKENCLEHLPMGILSAIPSAGENEPKSTFMGDRFSSDVREQMKGLLDYNKANEKYLDAYLEKYVRYESIDKVGNNNSGIILDNKSILANNSCFSLLAKNFYEDLKKIDRFELRPKINEKNEVENQVWNLALKEASGDAYLAMKLAGICGHDDVNQGSGGGDNNLLSSQIDPKKISNFISSALILCKNQLLKCSAKTSVNLSILSNTAGAPPTGCSECDALTGGALPNSKTCDQTLPSLVNKLEDIQSGKVKLGTTISCPVKRSVLFMPGSFPFDIDDNLKQTISDTQGKDILFKEATPPAKYYHQIGSAAIVCDLIKNGMPGDEAAHMQILFATAYRNVRICTGRKKDQKSFEAIEKVLSQSNDAKQSFEKVNKLILADNNLGGAFRSIGVSSDVFKDIELWSSKIKNIKAYLLANRMYSARTIKNVNVTSKDLEDGLIKEYGKNGALFLKKINTKISDGEGFFDKLKKGAAEKAGLTVADRECVLNNFALHLIPSSSEPCPSGTAQEICDLAKRKLKSWDVDTEWTRKSHRAGAEFAKKTCSSSKIDLNQKSCEALKNLTK